MGGVSDEYKRGLSLLYVFILVGRFLTFIKSIFVDIFELLKLFNKYLLCVEVIEIHG